MKYSGTISFYATIIFIGGGIMADIKKMYCPSCGAPVSFEPGREDTFCSSCGSQLYFQDDHLEVKLKHEERKMEHEEKILEYQDREATRKHEERSSYSKWDDGKEHYQPETDKFATDFVK